MLTSEQIREKFIEFLKEKGHKEIPNASLIPVNDPSVLFTTAGMHPLVPYLLGQSHPLGKRLTNVQRCLRTDDIEEVGDTTHLTFFEMLGYWSLGDYFKEFAIRTTFEFLTSEKYLGLDPKRIYATVYEGDSQVPKDEESIKIWQELFEEAGIKAEVYDGKDLDSPNLRIFPLNKKENWWGPAGVTGPCGPDSEFFYWRGEGEPNFHEYVPWDNSNMFIEVSNDVFMQYFKDGKGEFTPLQQKNVDYGGGFERLTLIVQKKDENGVLPLSYSLFDTDLFTEARQYLENLITSVGTSHGLSSLENETVKAVRVILDHIRAATFVIADGRFPSNRDQGYIVRRLIRRSVRFGKILGIEDNFLVELAEVYINRYKSAYPHLEENQNVILNEIDKEEIKFRRTLDKGLKELNRIKELGEPIDGAKTFFIYETYGFPLEMTLDELGVSEDEAKEITSQFKDIEQKHREQSRAGAEKKFKGGLADSSTQTTKLHTAHHLLLKALQIVLGEDVKQRGSNITAERLRIDFNYPEKLTDEQIKRVEEIVNEKISEGLNVLRIEMPKEEAEKVGAQMEFGQKYPDIVSVYFVTPEQSPLDPPFFKGGQGGLPSTYFSAEFCGGPHVENTKELGKFKIIKQENIGSGLRRIKAVLE
jgi:alanyl-tRNA synthetase